MNEASLQSWVDETLTTSLLVQVAGDSIIEINSPISASGWIGFDGALNIGEAEGGVGLPFKPLPDGRMQHDIASSQKNIISVLIAIAAERCLLSFNDPVSNHLDQGWSQSAPKEEAAITIWHLLTMTSGLGDDMSYVAPPGTVWRYNVGPAWHQLKPLLEAASEQTLQDLTDEWLAEPLGMEESIWIERPGMNYLNGRPFEALLTSARDLARFGNMILNKGTLAGRQILKTESITELLTPSQELNRAYGLLWWLNGQRPIRLPLEEDPIDRILIPSAPSDTVAALGALGQFCLITPSRQTVVVRLGSALVGDAIGLDITFKIWQFLNQNLFNN